MKVYRQKTENVSPVLEQFQWQYCCWQADHALPTVLTYALRFVHRDHVQQGPRAYDMRFDLILIYPNKSLLLHSDGTVWTVDSNNDDAYSQLIHALLN